jgi:hypothetical protein
VCVDSIDDDIPHLRFGCGCMERVCVCEHRHPTWCEKGIPPPDSPDYPPDSPSYTRCVCVERVCVCEDDGLPDLIPSHSSL